MPAPAPHLRVATFNIHHGVGVLGALDLQRTAAAIAGLEADVVGVQEVDRSWSARSGFADQAGSLAERLGLHLVFGVAVERPGSDRGRPPGQYGIAVLSRHPVHASRTTPLPRPRGGEQRALLEAEIGVPGGSLRFLNTHLQHNSRTERLAQAEVIRDRVAESDAPTVLVGDLNARADSSEVRLLTGHLVDAWSLGGDGDGHTFRARTLFTRIDYVLASPGVHVERARVVGTDASDHLPVVADLRLPAV